MLPHLLRCLFLTLRQVPGHFACHVYRTHQTYSALRNEEITMHRFTNTIRVGRLAGAISSKTPVDVFMRMSQKGMGGWRIRHAQNERAISLARSRPLCSDFRRSGSGSKSQRLSSQSRSAHTSYSPRALRFSYDHTRCKSFSLPSVSSCLDRVSLPIL